MTLQVLPSAWDDWHNAELYADFVRSYPVYRVLNRRLAILAELDGARRVLDLACGTGATALACLQGLPWDGELVGVDAAEAMVGVARAQVQDPRARFLVADAAGLENAVEGPFDRVVCNTAFWQLPDPASILDAVGRLLAPGGLFVFNLPADRMAGESPSVHGFQVALARAVETRTEEPYAQRAVSFEDAHMRSWIDAAELDLEERAHFAYQASQAELTELMAIPAMIASVAPQLSPEGRQAAVRQASGWVDAEAIVEVPWIYFKTRRRGVSDRRLLENGS